jgi:transposase
MEISNNDTNITQYMKKYLRDYKEKIIMESTGHYHLLSAVRLTENGFDARVINPLLAKKYFSGAIRKVKTDKHDAEILAEVALKEEKLPATFKLTRKDLEIRKKISLLGSLEKQLQQFNGAMANYQEAKTELKMKLSKTEQGLLKIGNHLANLKKQLELEITELANENQTSKKIAERFQTIPGVSKYVSVIAANFFDDTVNGDAKQWVAYAGMDVSIKQSGKWTGRGKITKRGNAYLRKRLFSAAWGAVMHDKQFKQYYDQLRKNGRSYIEALVTIARKIVRIMISLTKNETVYESVISLPSAN